MLDQAQAVQPSQDRSTSIPRHNEIRPAVENQREDGRVKTFLKARILHREGNLKLDCLVKDMSETGAKIELDDRLKIPPVFSLEIPKLGAMFRAEIRWRYGHLIGVKFVAASQPIPDESPTRDELLAENAALLQTVRKLAERLTQLGEPVMISLAPQTASPVFSAK